MRQTKKQVSRMIGNPAPLGTPEPAPAETNPAAISQEWARVREIALRRLERFISLEPKVLRGDDLEAIHDLRVASRRLQQVLDLLYPETQDKEVRRLRRRIRLSRRALGEVRNCDVLLGLVDRSLQRKSLARREAWSALERYLSERRLKSFGKAVRKLSKLTLGGLYVRLRELFSPEGSGHHLRGPSVIAFPDQSDSEPVRTRIARSLERVWEPFERQVNAARRDSSAATLHAARIAAKRLRYLIEVVHDIGLADGSQALAWLRRFQQHLGDWHDLEVLEQMMVKMVARPAFLRHNLELVMQVARLILRVRARKKRFELKVLEMTGETEDWKRLEQWVVHLMASPPEVFARG